MAEITQSTSGLSTAQTPKNLSSYISPVQLQRLRVDLKGWRSAIAEAEYAYFPHRVKMQQMYIDTILNGHVAALMERRQDLTMLRKFKMTVNGTVSDVMTQQFEESQWFEDFMQYALDAGYFGYSLISLGDITNDSFDNLSIVRRWNISPDRRNVTSFIYNPNGVSFDDPKYKDWHVYVKTRSENGVSPCGYGLFYKIALYEIFLRNTLGFNGDFVELYSQPYRVGKTTKTDESERGELESALKNMGSSGYAIIDQNDTIEFLETALGGTGYKGYESLEDRCSKTVSKLILGHADAIDSTPGKLGSGQPADGMAMDGSPVAMALGDKQTKDGRNMQRIVNNDLIPKCIALGMKLPKGLKLQFSNDAEAMELKNKTGAINLQEAQIAQAMKSGGLDYDPAAFTKATGIAAVATPPPPTPTISGPAKRVQQRIERMYGIKK